MASHVALLKGINVGGRQRLAMSALRSVMAGLGYDDVATYPASGNALFTAPDASRQRCCRRESKTA